MQRIFAICLLTFCIVSCSFGPASADDTREAQHLFFFFSPACHNCHEVERTALAELEEKFGDSLVIHREDVNNLESYTRLLALREKQGLSKQFDVPVVFFRGMLLTGRKEITDNLGKLSALILAEAAAGHDGQASGFDADLAEKFRNFRPLAVIGAGLADGVNPCAFTVIIFFISFLSVQGYRKKALACIGFSFIFAVFLTYLFIGLGIFNFLYQLRGFWIISRLVNSAVGVLSIVFGLLSLYDIIVYKRTGQAQGMVLQLPGAVKHRIHAIIGHFYRVKNRDDGEKPRLWKLGASALVTGFLVSLLEAVCTGQLYLPTIIFVLKTSELKLQAFNYLLLYNFMFIVPLCVIFVLALFGATSVEFTGFLRKHLVAAKGILAVIFFGLGFFLLRRM